MRENRPITMRARGTEAGSRRNERAPKIVTRPPTQRVTPRMCAASATSPTPDSVNSKAAVLITKSVAAAWVPATPIPIAANPRTTPTSRCRRTLSGACFRDREKASDRTTNNTAPRARLRTTESL